MRIPQLPLLLALSLVACDGSSTPGADAAPETSVAPDLAAGDFSFGPGEVVETREDSGTPDLPPSDFGPACDPGSGCFLDPCEEDIDCLSGYCVEHMGDKVCTIYCIEECPSGWACEEFAGGPDQVFLCLSPFSHLCRPCATSLDCRSPSGVEDVCVDYGPDGNFCGAPCAEASDCPDGYLCDEVETTQGAALLQCVPESGECPCSSSSIALGLGTVCEVENEHGTCHGIRICEEEGLSPCSAKQPSVEVCNGIDDDCDGDSDEGTCEDDNPCTEDACTPEDGGCVYVDLTGTSCDDGDVCTIADHCEEGECTGTFVDCEDDNPCTDDQCDASGGCLYEFNNDLCDDGEPCTVQDHCDGGICVGTEIPCDCEIDADCEILEDGDACNGVLVCDVEQIPFKCVVDLDTIITCPPPEDPEEECLEAWCDPITGYCDIIPVEDGTFCDDDDACSQSDSCVEGECVGAVPLICIDGNPCTDDLCDPTEGCLYTPNEAPCNDDDACTYWDLCVDGDCASGGVLDCDDLNPCTDDSCDTLLGCVHDHNQATCDDSNACTALDGCIDGICVGAGVPDCDDDNPCTLDWCDPGPGCQHENHTLPCDDGDKCVVGEACLDGACVGGEPLNCNDGNPCTHDLCDPVDGCVAVFNSLPCDDGNVCTLSDVCSLGSCSGPDVVNCSDGNSCTQDSCAPEVGCVFTSITGACNDGNPCTIGDVCQGGLCIGPLPLDCDDGNPCTDDYCTVEDGCLNVVNNAPCSDGNPCTTFDTCLNGICVGLAETSCDDGNPCTSDSCAPESGCQNLYNSLPCDDGNSCTTNDVCVAGVCKGTGTLVCDDGNPCTYDTCLPDGGCEHQAVTGSCSDDDPCTVDDSCEEGECASGIPKNCDDLNPCTTDGCSLGQCTHLPVDGGSCNDGNLCTVGDSCQDGSCAGIPKLCDDENGCTVDYCDPALGCVAQAKEDLCDDGNPCTEDACHPLTGCFFTPTPGACDDGNPCTLNDACSDGQCFATTFADCDDGEICTDDACLPSVGCVNSPNSNPCEDGDVCTLQDYCAGGGCNSGSALDCDDGNPCTDDSCHPTFGCQNPPNDDPCDNSNPCTTGDACSNGACQAGGLADCGDGIDCTVDGCNPFLGCTNTPVDALCGDDIPCTINSCGPSGCTLLLDHDACDDGDPCTADTCDPDLGCLHSDEC